MNQMQNKVLATVNGQPITQADVEGLLLSMGQRGAQYNNEEGRKMILNQLIDQKLFLADARKNFYEADPAFKAEMERVKEDILTNFTINKALAAVRVDDSEIKQYYDENQERFQSGETVNADHILVDSEEKAQELLEKIHAGTLDFAQAAREYSSCPSGKEGGKLGDFAKGQMVPEFDQAVFGMQEGEVAGPVKTQFGYHLIRLNRKNASAPIPFAQIKEQLRGMLLQEKQQKAYESKVNQLKLLYPVDLY